jgi:DNA-binding NtrC family response regulator
MEEIQKEAVQKTLAETGGNKTEAAKILDIGVRTIYRKLDDYEQEADNGHDTLTQE